jgi:hypothetical protein
LGQERGSGPRGEGLGPAAEIERGELALRAKSSGDVFPFLFFCFLFVSFFKAYFKTNFENHLKISLNHFVFWDQITQHNKMNSPA